MRFQVGGTGLGIGVGSKGLINPLEVKFSYAWARVIPKYDGTHINGVKSSRSGHSSPICLLDWRFALTFLQLSIIDSIFNPSFTITV